MRDHSKHIELRRDDAVASMIKALPSNFEIKAQEQVELTDGYGRVLAEDVLYQTDIPNTLTCSLDSIAVHWDDFANTNDGVVPDTTDWVRGKDWEFANTGVAMPDGFDTAIVIEHVEVSDDESSIRIEAAPSKRYAGARAAGSNAKRGEVAVAAGCIITPDIAARIASAGVRVVTVRPKPRIAFIPTGDELVPSNLPYSKDAPSRFAGYGKVYESNSALVQGKVEAWGGIFVPFDIVPDEKCAIRAAIEHACKVADIVVLNAGSSKGSDDWSVEVLEEMGEMVCHQTNHGPGHHSSYAIVDDTPIVGISGPAGGASFTLNFYLLPLIRKYYGLEPNSIQIPARLIKEFPAGRMSEKAKMPQEKFSGEQRPPEATKPEETFYSIKYLMLETDEQGQLTALPMSARPGSAEAESANALFMMPAGVADDPPKVGDIIHVELRTQSLV